MNKTTIEYRVPYADTDQMGVVYYGKYDDLLEVTAWCRAHKGVRLEIACEVRRKGEEELLVSGFTRHCFVSTETFHPIPPPDKFIAILDA